MSILHVQRKTGGKRGRTMSNIWLTRHGCGHSDFVFDRSGSVGVLTFGNHLTGAKVATIHEALMVCLERTDYLVVNFGHVLEADTPCMQALCEAHTAALQSHKRLSLTGVRRELMQQTITEVCSACSAEGRTPCGSTCLWLEDIPSPSH